jgi:hypothetical protein
LDKYIFGPFKLSSGFTINCSTLSYLDSLWVKDVSMTSLDLWASKFKHLMWYYRKHKMEYMGINR